MTTHLVQYSTGVASAEVAWRVAERHGAAGVVLLTADTRVEDADNWRFAREVVDWLGVAWTVLADGRTPMQVGRDHGVVPNNRMAVCSRVLKRELLRAHIEKHYSAADSVVYLGFDWTEPERHDRAVPLWAPYTVSSPLLQPPYLAKPDLLALWRERGIEPPRLYRYNLGHSNCGGGCVRGGQAHWQALLRRDREQYLAWEAEENKTRVHLGKDVSILRDRSGGDTRRITLAEFRQRLDRQPSLFDADDWGACGCFTTEEETA